MSLRSGLSTIKRKVRNGNKDIDESFDSDDLTLEVYVQEGYLVFEIPNTHGDPHRPEVTHINKVVISMFDTVMLPNPHTGSVSGSTELSELS